MNLKGAARCHTCADTRNAFARYFLPPAFVCQNAHGIFDTHIPCKLQNRQEHSTTWASLASYLKRFPWSWSCRDGASSPGRKRNPPEGSTNLIQIASIHVGKYNKNQHCTEYEALLSVFSQRTCLSPLAPCRDPLCSALRLTRNCPSCCALGTSSK